MSQMFPTNEQEYLDIPEEKSMDMKRYFDLDCALYHLEQCINVMECLNEDYITSDLKACRNAILDLVDDE